MDMFGSNGRNFRYRRTPNTQSSISRPAGTPSNQRKNPFPNAPMHHLRSTASDIHHRSHL